MKTPNTTKATRAAEVSHSLGNGTPPTRTNLLEALKHAVICVEYCRRNHPDAQNGSGFPVEILWKELIAKADGRAQ